MNLGKNQLATLRRIAGTTDVLPREVRRAMLARLMELGLIDYTTVLYFGPRTRFIRLTADGRAAIRVPA